MSRPNVDFLTRDDPGYRQLLVSLLDRAPTAWRERSAADAGIVLVDLLANELDHLAYAADRIANEGHLGTARRRQSIRQHAMLADHVLDRGQLSRGMQAFVVRDTAPVQLPARVRLGTSVRGEETLGFETSAAATLRPDLNTFRLVRSAAAGARRLWLEPGGADGDLTLTALAPGLVLAIVEEERHELVTVQAVASACVDLVAPLVSGYTSTEEDGGGTRGALVYGNLVPIRRGTTTDWTPLGTTGVLREEVSPTVWFTARLATLQELLVLLEDMREAWVHDRDALCGRDLALRLIDTVVRRLRRTRGSVDPNLAAELDGQLRDAAQLLLEVLRAVDGWSAQTVRWHADRIAVVGRRFPLGPRAVGWSNHEVTLEVRLRHQRRTEYWQEVEDFLRSTSTDRHFLVEVDQGGRAVVLFGDGVHGALPPVDATLEARFVIADPFAGNVGAGTLEQLEVSRPPATDIPSWAQLVERTFNPVPTSGWRAPERADGLPATLRRELGRPVVAVTTADHLELLQRRADVLEAALVEEVKRSVSLVARAPAGADPVSTLAAWRAHAEATRLAGTKVVIGLPRVVPVSVEVVVDLHPEVAPAEARHNVRLALRSLFREGQTRPELGRTIALGELYRTIEAVPGVIWSAVTRFSPAVTMGVHQRLELQVDQVARCADVADEPERGTLQVARARRFSLVLAEVYEDLDALPDGAWLEGQIRRVFTGRDGVASREGWQEITVARIEAALAPITRGRYRLEVLHLRHEGRRFDRLPLVVGELAWLDHLQVVPTFHPPSQPPGSAP